jgi:hypothetical protein
MPSTQDNLEKLRSSKPSPRVVTAEDESQLTAGHRAQRIPGDVEYVSQINAPHEFKMPELRDNAQKIALFNAAWTLYLTMRPKIAFPDLPKAPNTNSPLEAKTDYAKALSAQLQTAQEYAANESKALWKKLFNEDI